MQTEDFPERELLPYPFGSPRDILTALFRQKIKILIVFLGVLLGVAGWVYSKDTLYEARATIILKFGREHIFRPEIGEVNQIVRFNESAAVNSELKILESKDLARRAVIAIGVQNIYPELMGQSDEVQEWQIEVATSKFLGNLKGESNGGGTNVLEIGFSHKKPKVAAMALNVLIDVLKEKHLQVFSDPKSAFLVQRLEEYREDLDDADNKLHDFKERHDLSSPLEDQQRRLLDQRAHLDSENKTINNQLQGLLGKVASLEHQMKSIPRQIPLSTTEQGGTIDKAKADLFSLERELHGLRAKYTLNSAPIQNIKNEIELVKEFIRTETNRGGAKSITSGKNPIFQELEVTHLTSLSELKTLQASNRVIIGQIQELDKKIQRLDTLKEELTGLARIRVTADENFTLYVKKVEEAKVSEEMDQMKMSNIKVIQSADIPSAAAGRPKKTKMIIGALFGMIMSLGLGFVFEYFQGGYTRPDQAAEDLGLPVLASFGQKG